MWDPFPVVHIKSGENGRTYIKHLHETCEKKICENVHYSAWSLPSYKNCLLIAGLMIAEKENMQGF